MSCLAQKWNLNRSESFANLQCIYLDMVKTEEEKLKERDQEIKAREERDLEEMHKHKKHKKHHHENHK